MLKHLPKYLLLAFLLENLCTKTLLLYKYTTPVFYLFLAIGLLMVVRTINWNDISKERFGWMFGITAIYTFHCFVIGLEYLNSEILIYLVAKVSTFFIIITTLNADLDYFEDRGIYLFSLVAGLFILQGLILPGSEVVFDGNERSALGFVNSNSLGGTATIVFGILLCRYKNRNWDRIPLLICCIAAFAGLASGSRSSMVVMALIFLSQYRLSVKSISMIAAAAFIVLILLPSVGIEVAGVTRIKGTIEGEIGTNREPEREAAMWMINEHPLTGWGLVTENKGYAAQITMMSSHNSYMDLAKTMGIPLAILWFLIVVSVILKYLTNMRQLELPFDFFCVYALCTLFKGFFEAMFAGVHEIECNMFYVSVAVLSIRLYNAKLCE